MTIVSIHQPGYLPWLGFFKKIEYSDVFVILDDVKYVKRQWHNRNQIRTSQGNKFLSVPIKGNSGKNINEVEIDYSQDWRLIHKKTIKYSYSKAKYFEQYWNLLEKIFSEKFEKLLELNWALIDCIMKELKLEKKIIFSSDLDIQKTKSDRNLAICKKLKASVYLSGTLGKNYLNEQDFSNNGIKVEFQNFQHPIYTQCYEPFIPNMATIDILFNEGENASTILKNANNF